MVSSVSSSNSQQNAQQLQLIQQKKQENERNVRENQQPSTSSVQRSKPAEQKQPAPETQNSQQAKGASLDVRA